MAPFVLETWLAIGAIGLACAVGALYVLASVYRNEIVLHDLRVRVTQLRKQYAKRLAEDQARYAALEGFEEGELVEAAPAPLPGPASPAAAKPPAKAAA